MAFLPRLRAALAALWPNRRKADDAYPMHRRETGRVGARFDRIPAWLEIACRRRAAEEDQCGRGRELLQSVPALPSARG
jgi:hypothetical protein